MLIYLFILKNKTIDRSILLVIIVSIIGVIGVYYLFKTDLSFLILYIFILSVIFIIYGYNKASIEMSLFGYTTLVIAIIYLYLYKNERISNLKKFRSSLNNNNNYQTLYEDTYRQLENCESENRHVKRQLSDIETELKNTTFELNTLLDISSDKSITKKRKRIV
jgi:hypothetical protein